jgi:hypothetical protein
MKKRQERPVGQWFLHNISDEAKHIARVKSAEGNMKYGEWVNLLILNSEIPSGLTPGRSNGDYQNIEIARRLDLIEENIDNNNLKFIPQIDKLISQIDEIKDKIKDEIKLNSYENKSFENKSFWQRLFRF